MSDEDLVIHHDSTVTTGPAGPVIGAVQRVGSRWLAESWSDERGWHRHAYLGSREEALDHLARGSR